MAPAPTVPLLIAFAKTLDACSSSEEKRNHKQNEKHCKQDFCDSRRGASDSAESEQRCDQRNNQ